VVELVTRAQRHGWVQRASDPGDARLVQVSPTDDGGRILARLVALHRDQLRYMDVALALPTWHDDPGF
jgi:DNA-binding MarR family transcriptional regulator